MKLLKDKEIAIIGAGPGGLTLARLLQQKGAAVIVYERDFNREVRAQGATLDLHYESGLLALEKAGLMEAFKQVYRPDADRLRVVDQYGKIFLDDHEEESKADFGDEYFRPEIDRGPLRNLLLDSLQPDTVIWDRHIRSIEAEGEKWKIFFQNGHTATADIVIGADGANSKIRSVVTPIKPFYSGVTILEANVADAAKNSPNVNSLLKGGKIMGLNNSKTLSMSAKGDGSIDFYAGWRVEDSWAKDSGIDFGDHQQVMDWFRKEYAGWGDIWLELFKNAGTTFNPRPQYCMPLDQNWEAHANITLIGDAAHLMPPYAGEGVNMAMLDALQLSESLTDDSQPNLKTAIGHYEQQMFERFAKIGQETLDNTELMHSPDGLRKLLQMFEGPAGTAAE
ncbi:NAD(P)/FAD-dependent oxidoreductase [Pedobacter sp. MC2016-15]|uniref:FAD-dependent oxidoreductase n=1 Tax=Pedobacter sp. MC2016-15 TaxID=2994473 RepID=UPI0022475321|nr:NAD(P)/FAD-dependent oxidoreductase [Pedobacter sp. MC2016-15]MCX2478284.1 NAD(P)/FAD-dependent oxidoreductase [Pedobacter sp. MC2016-15]